MASIRSGIGENMEDRYLFKAKHFEKWHIGNIVKEPDGLYIRDIKGNVMAYIDDESTICQCTGLKDKNGKLIWENDIVVCRDFTEEKYVIAWKQDEACFEYQQYGCSIMNFEQLSGCEVEAIGNIFDNPELLESEE